MKLSSSTGDFSHFVETVPQKIECFGETKFQYINLEQTGEIRELVSENNEDWKVFADACGDAAARAGVALVLSHAPCLHKAILPAMTDRADETYQYNLRALRRSIRVCNRLGIERLVVHACTHKELDAEGFARYNEMFYGDLLKTAEEQGILLLTENRDNDSSHFSTGKQMRELIDRIDHPLLAACWDTAHGNIAKDAREVGQYQNILALGDKLRALHISDNFGDVHHHSWPFAGIINFDEVMQGLIDVKYDGVFNFEASYTLLHHKNIPYHRAAWEQGGKTVTRLLDPSLALKQKAVDLLYDVGVYLLEEYGILEA